MDRRLLLIKLIKVGLGLVFMAILSPLYGQYKADNPATYQPICYYIINKEKFKNYEKVKKIVLEKNYSKLLPYLHQMRAKLQKFDLSLHNRAFEIWYLGNYIDYEQQVITAKKSTLVFLKRYENKLKNKTVLYYEHRMFLELFLSYATEYFYPDFWFVSMERFFSKTTVDRIKRMNPEEGQKLFENSDFFSPFDIFNDLAESEEKEIKNYLDRNQAMLDSSTFIPYSYLVLHRPTSHYVLSHIILDNATQDIDTDRQVTALLKILKAVQENKVILVAKLNWVALRKLKKITK